jgi:hypothetical protein
LPLTAEVCQDGKASSRWEQESMSSHRKELVMEVPRRRAFVNITAEVEAALAESGI